MTERYTQADEVIDQISQLVDESLAAGPPIFSPRDACPKCHGAWHGTRNGVCPGPFEDGEVDLKVSSPLSYTPWRTEAGSCFTALCEDCGVARSYHEKRRALQWASKHQETRGHLAYLDFCVD